MEIPTWNTLWYYTRVRGRDLEIIKRFKIIQKFQRISYKISEAYVCIKHFKCKGQFRKSVLNFGHK